MSLAFVTSAVQTGTADGGYEEKAIESKEVQDVNQRNQHKPLFEQLRTNQEEEDEKKEELQREMMRGTCALNEEDVAHLDALEKQRMEREREIQLRMQDEVAMFRAARVERQQHNLQEEEDDDDDKDDDEHQGLALDKNTTNKEQITGTTNVANVVAEPMAPKIIVKKRKRRVESKEKTAKTEPDQHKKTKQQDVGEKDEKKAENKSAGLGGLLCGYGSSDEDSE